MFRQRGFGFDVLLNKTNTKIISIAIAYWEETEWRQMSDPKIKPPPVTIKYDFTVGNFRLEPDLEESLLSMEIRKSSWLEVTLKTKKQL